MHTAHGDLLPASNFSLLPVLRLLFSPPMILASVCTQHMETFYLVTLRACVLAKSGLP